MQSNLRPALPLFLVAMIAAAFFFVTAGSDGATVPRCATYKSQAAAQADFIEAGGGVQHAVGALDPDHDGVACEGLGGPYAGYATLGYNKRKNFFYGTASLPRSASGNDDYPCMVGNSHFLEGPRRLNVFKVEPGGGGKPIFAQRGIGAEARPSSGRLLWRADRKVVIPGSYYAEFEERARSSPRGNSECPSFRSETVKLP
jgi:hypothetical protein